MRATAPSLKASDVWDERGPLFAQFEALGLLFFVRGATLGADTGTVTHGVTEAGEPFCTRVETTNVLNNEAHSTNAALEIAGLARSPGGRGGTLIFEARIRLEQLADYRFVAGINTGGIPLTADSMVLAYDNSVGGNWLARSYEAAEENTDTGIVADLLWHTLKIVLTAASVAFYIDDVIVATHIVQIPDRGLATKMDTVIVYSRTLAAAIKYGRYEYVAVWNE